MDINLPLCVSLQAQAQCELTEVNIETSTDEWGEEMSWTLFQSLEIGGAFPLASFQGQFDGDDHKPNLVLGRWLLLLLSVGLVGF